MFKDSIANFYTISYKNSQNIAIFLLYKAETLWAHIKIQTF